ncbi:MAG: RNA polymerase sigma factor [Candidatus Cloacimonetes bacterium]|nr:RNA polymerase sigma factor [Candidatus Cloacimonadota bacterium]
MKFLYIKEDENTLLEQCRQQIPAAQKYLFEIYNKKMLTVCLRYIKNEDDALDIINHAFLKVFLKIKQYKSEGRLETWIKRIVINTTIDYIKSDKSYKKNFVQANEFKLYGEPNNEDDVSDKWWDAATSLSMEQLFKMIQNLPPATQLVFNLYALDEYSHKEISKQLKISEGTSKWHLFNARRILKENINKSLTINSNIHDTKKYR